MSPRKKSDKSKDMRFEIRLTRETYDKLEKCAEVLNISKAAVVHKGIDLVESEIKK